MRRTGDAVPAPVWCDPAECPPPNLCLGGRRGRFNNFQLPFLVLGPGVGQLNVPAAVTRLDSQLRMYILVLLAVATTPASTPPWKRPRRPRRLRLRLRLRRGWTAATAASRRASGTLGGQAARRSQIARADTRRVATDVATKPIPAAMVKILKENANAEKMPRFAGGSTMFTFKKLTQTRRTPWLG